VVQANIEGNLFFGRGPRAQPDLFFQRVRFIQIYRVHRQPNASIAGCALPAPEKSCLPACVEASILLLDCGASAPQPDRSPWIGRMDSHAEESYSLDRSAGRAARAGCDVCCRANGRSRGKRDAESCMALPLIVSLRILAKNKQVSLLFASWP